MDVLKLITELKIIPLGTLVSEEDVSEICDCLIKADTPIIEVTLRDERVKKILNSISFLFLKLSINRILRF